MIYISVFRHYLTFNNRLQDIFPFSCDIGSEGVLLDLVDNIDNVGNILSDVDSEDLCSGVFSSSSLTLRVCLHIQDFIGRFITDPKR